MNTDVLTNFFLIAHAVSTLGIGGWYLGIIPHGVSEKRFLPLALYMFTCATNLVCTWLAHYSPLLASLLPAIIWLSIGLAALFYGRAYWCAIQSEDHRTKWPWSLRIFTIIHLLVTLALPLLTIDHHGTLPLSVTSGSALALVILMVFSHLGFVRRRGHQLHWSMIAVVLLWLVVGSLAINQSYKANLRIAERDLLERSQSLADLLQHDEAVTLAATGSTAERLSASLEGITRNSTYISCAFVIRATQEGAKYVAMAEGRGHSRMNDPVLYLENLAFTARGIPLGMDVFDDTGGSAWVALAGVYDGNSNTPSGALGLFVSRTRLESETSKSILATELIVFLIALVIFAALGGYLHGYLRITQRDALIEISSSVTQRLLRDESPYDTAPWLTKALFDKLDLVYVAFWICADHQGEPGFRVAASLPQRENQNNSEPLARLNPIWRESLCNNSPLSGSLEDVGEPIRGLIPEAQPKFWVSAQNISFKDQPWGAIVAVFPNKSHSSNRELGKTLESIASAFSFSLYREERGESLAAAEERFRTIVDTSQDGFWDVDFENDRAFRSKRWWEMVGLQAKSLTGKTEEFEELIHEQDLERIHAQRAKVLDQGQKHGRRLFRIKHRDGRWRWVESNMVEIRLRRGPVCRAIGFDRDVTERLGYEKRLKESADSAKRANEAKSQFLATVSHELRTPLNSIMGFTNMLNHSTLDMRQRDWVESVANSGEQLLALISDLLDISRIEAGQMKLEIASFELLRICEQAMEHFTHAALEKRIGLHLNFPTSMTPVWVSGDALRLRQILTNLIGNAVKFTQTGYVRLSVTRDSDHDWKFEVEDTGPGIPKEETERLFNRFEQIDASSTRRFGGTGLGLAISRELARSMSGDITVESAVDVGSTFTMTATLPRVVGPARRATDFPLCDQRSTYILDGNEQEVEEIQSITEGVDCSIQNFQDVASLVEQLKGISEEVTVLVPRAYRPRIKESVKALRAALVDKISLIKIIGIQMDDSSIADLSIFDLEFNSPIKRRDFLSVICGLKIPDSTVLTGRNPINIDQTGEAVSIRVLVAEDNEMNRKLIGLMLDELGVITEFAEDGAAALEMLRSTPYDLALIDIQMPKLDGYDVAISVQQNWHDRWPQPPLVAVTANVIKGVKEKCQRAGMVDFISKPISLGELSKVIIRHTESLGTAPAGSEIPKKENFPSVDPKSAYSEEQTSAVIDWKCFEAVCELSGVKSNPDILRNLISSYLTETTSILSQIKELAGENPDKIKRLLHKIKGSTGSLGFTESYNLIHHAHEHHSAVERAEMHRICAAIRESVQATFLIVQQRYPTLGNVSENDQD
ncbi:MAG: hypothetical protein SynsKO_36140 [Synoicihabitans sp.]